MISMDGVAATIIAGETTNRAIYLNYIKMSVDPCKVGLLTNTKRVVIHVIFVVNYDNLNVSSKVYFIIFYAKIITS